MRRLIFWTTVASGVVAAVLLYRRGVAPSEIAVDVVQHPFRSLVNELHTPAPQPKEA